jgi:hypothetical protein
MIAREVHIYFDPIQNSIQNVCSKFNSESLPGTEEKVGRLFCAATGRPFEWRKMAVS